ncbi:MAG: hypothetical protein H6741_25865 [Alphaproteobacteria bacterium]|nr:hypothetical protein [Alphaproteobacteria bacterium]
MGAPLLAAPLNAWLYLVFWNVGLSRVAGHEVGLGHAFPMRVVPRAAVVMMVYSPLGLLNLIHPAASLATVPVSMVVFWMLPCFLDRDMSVADALQASLRLVQYNWLSMLGLALATLIFYVLATLTCGIGFFWFLPWSCVVLGESWRQLCGFQDMR